jgi:hypothetical protein
MAESDFMAAFDKRISEGGFDPQNMRGVGNEKRVADVAKMAKSVSGKQRPKLRQTGMGSFDPETGARASADQLKTVKEFEDYDAMREQLAGYITGNMYQGNKKPDMEQARKIVDDFARAQREQQYATPAATTGQANSEQVRSPMERQMGVSIPTPVPATATATATTPANQSTEAPSPSYGRSDEAIAEMEAARNQPTSAPSPSYGRSDEAIAEMEAARNQAPKAAPVIDEARMAALFRKTTGTAFDPKSRVDTARMADLTSFIEKDPDLLNKSDTKIALDYYRTLK